MSYVKTRVQYTMVGSDFSAQEPRLLAAYSNEDTSYDEVEDIVEECAIISVVYS